MAAPVEIENPNWHRSELLLYECEWKQGDLAIVNREGRRKYGAFSLARDRWYPATRSEKLSKKEVAEDAQRLPLVGIQVCSLSDQKDVLDTRSLLMEGPWRDVIKAPSG